MTAVALSFVFLLLLANLIVIQYGQGVVRAALDEGARVGATVDGTTRDCEARANRALDDLFGGSMRKGVAVRCEDHGDVIVATAEVEFKSWMPAFMDDWSFRSTATVVKEHGP